MQDGAGNTLNGLTLLDRGYTGHEHLQSVGLIHMNGRLYDAKLHRFLQPDNFVQDPTNTQNYNRYGYCWNNPLKHTDVSGEFIWVIVGAIIGGTINWIAHGAQFNVRGLTAFGIGAGAGALAGFVGPAAFTVAGGGAAGTGGFVAGAFGGAVGAYTSQTILSVGNHIAFGDPLISGKEMIIGIAFGAALGGTINGVSALKNGKTFLIGTDPTPKVSPISLPQPADLSKTANPEIKTNTKLPSTTQTSTTPTTQANTSKTITVTKNVDGNGYKIQGLELDTGAVKLEEVVVHGNSLSSQKPTWGYKLYSNEGTFLKNGITNKLIPETRYTKAFMSDKYMEAIPFPNRLKAYQWEYQQNLIQRGPLNLNMH